ncbi:MAG: VOC family protein [Archangium sp.]|nr:VOC family protein [Archangium sp.]
MSQLELISVVVHDYDEAISFFRDVLDFELVEDVPSLTNDGRTKRWVIVRPRGGVTGILLAKADGERQKQVVGAQFAGRVGLFLRVDDFEASVKRMRERGVDFTTEPRDEPYGRVVVFKDRWGNKWDLLGPPPAR